MESVYLILVLKIAVPIFRLRLWLVIMQWGHCLKRWPNVQAMHILAYWKGIVWILVQLTHTHAQMLAHYSVVILAIATLSVSFMAIHSLSCRPYGLFLKHFSLIFIFERRTTQFCFSCLVEYILGAILLPAHPLCLRGKRPLNFLLLILLIRFCLYSFHLLPWEIFDKCRAHSRKHKDTDTVI